MGWIEHCTKIGPWGPALSPVYPDQALDLELALELGAEHPWTTPVTLKQGATEPWDALQEILERVTQGAMQC